jgi:catecholate siderophore receptor
VYASYGVTYLPRSGEQLSSLAANSESLDPEEFENYEIGAKWDIRSDLSASLAVYQLNRSNAAVADPVVPGQLILLSGDSQRVEGVELSLSGKITEQWSIIGSYAYQDAKTVQTVGTTPAGRKLALTPENTAGLWNRYDFSPRWGIGLGTIYRDDSFASISNAVTVKGYTRFDGAVYFNANDNFGVQLNIENLFDKDYYVFANSDSNITPGSPRGAYLSMNVKF